MADLIERQAAIDALAEQIALCDKALNTFGISMKDEYAVKVEKASLVAYKEQLEFIPAAQPERKKGKWNFIGDNMFECTYCGVVYTTQQLNGLRNYDVDPYAPKFCPNCGADMRGGQDELRS